MSRPTGLSHSQQQKYAIFALKIRERKSKISAIFIFKKYAVYFFCEEYPWLQQCGLWIGCAALETTGPGIRYVRASQTY